MRRTTLLALLGGIVLMVVAVACSSSDSDVSSGPTSPPGTGTTIPIAGSMMTTIPASDIVTGDTLVDQTFVSTSVEGHDLVAGSEIRLSFNASQVTANAGCNTMSAAYSLEGGALVVDGEVTSTMMGCDQELMDQDTWLAGFLASSPVVTATGSGIALEADGVTVELASGDQVGTPTLVGPTWTLETIERDGTASNVPAGVEPPTLVFADDGTVAVFTGCNGGSTTAVVGDDGFITFEPMMTTMMSCGTDADAVAAVITTALDGRVAFGWSGTGDLSLATGGQSLIFTAA